MKTYSGSRGDKGSSCVTVNHSRFLPGRYDLYLSAPAVIEEFDWGPASGCGGLHLAIAILSDFLEGTREVLACAGAFHEKVVCGLPAERFTLHGEEVREFLRGHHDLIAAARREGAKAA